MTCAHNRHLVRALAGYLAAIAVLASSSALAQKPVYSIRDTIFSTAPSPDDLLGARAGYESPYTNAALPNAFIGAAQQRGERVPEAIGARAQEEGGDGQHAVGHRG